MLPSSTAANPMSSMDKRRAELAESLARLKANPRVERINVIVSDDACPAGRALQGYYSKDDVPVIPDVGCSHPIHCTCAYQPALNDIFP